MPYIFQPALLLDWTAQRPVDLSYPVFARPQLRSGNNLLCKRSTGPDLKKACATSCREACSAALDAEESKQKVGATGSPLVDCCLRTNSIQPALGSVIDAMLGEGRKVGCSIASGVGVLLDCGV